MAKSREYEVIIIGAGASGLACAHQLHKQNVDLTVLEARPRIGGRVYSHKEKNDYPAIELGAEFIHGAPAEMLNLLKMNQQGFFDVQEGQLFLKGKKLVEQKDFWKKFEKLIALTGPQIKNDRSMAEFIKAHQKSIPQDMRQLLTAYIEGFQAADINIIGERAFARSELHKKSLNEAGNFRLTVPYIQALEGLIKDNSLKKRILLEHVVTEIQLSAKGAKVICRLPSGRSRSFNTRDVILSVPIGVLINQHPGSRIKISPHISELTEALAPLAVGHAHRVTLVFEDRFWEDLSKTPVGFLRAGPQHYFPTWWTMAPLRVPYLVGWQGGPKALEISGWSTDKCLDTALSTLSQLTRKTKKSLHQQLVSFHFHNWSQDPFSLGAYTYTRVTKHDRPWDFNKPFRKFLWLTGEGVATDEAQGTVHGALRKGFETAESLLNNKRRFL